MISETISPYKIVYYGCRCAGILKNDGKPWSILVTIYHILSINSLGLTIFLEICLSQGNLKNTVEAMCLFAIYIQINYKAINMLLREKDFRNLLDRLETFRLEILKDENNRKYVTEAEIISRKLILVINMLFNLSPILAFIFTTVAAIIDFDQKRLTLAIWIPWEMQDFSTYMAGNILASLAYLTACIIYVSIGIIEITFTFQISAYLQVLQDYLKTKGMKDGTVYRYHFLCIQFINDYNDILSGPLYLEILLSSIMPCGFAFSLIKTMKTNSFQFDVILPTSACLAAPCLVCYCGQIISNKVEKLHESSYMSYWYEEKPKIRRNLLTLMTMTTKPTVPNYRKFVRFDHVCLASVFQALYSFFMMIINFDTD